MTEKQGIALEKKIRNQLFELQDMDYRSFQSKLMPTIEIERVIGVRTPLLRKYAREFAREPESHQYLDLLPHFYYEENNLHGFLIEQLRDYEECLVELERFLPYVDNWATCDLMRPKVFQKNLPRLLESIEKWIESDQTYTIRFGIEMLMCYYLGEKFMPEYLSMVSKIRSKEYYVNMMTAWYFATALAKQPKAAMPYIAERKLDCWTHNKAIQKALESNRITAQQKQYLKTLKIKG